MATAGQYPPANVILSRAGLVVEAGTCSTVGAGSGAAIGAIVTGFHELTLVGEAKSKRTVSFARDAEQINNKQPNQTPIFATF